MKIVVLYRPDSEHETKINSFVREFSSRASDVKQPEMINVNTRDGWSLASLYDVVQYPAILVLKDDGQLQKSFEGRQLPLVNEVVSYLRA